MCGDGSTGAGRHAGTTFLAGSRHRSVCDDGRGRRSGCPARRRRAFHRHDRPPNRNRLSPHESRRPACPRSLPCVSVRELGVQERPCSGGALGTTESRWQTTEGHEPHPVRAGRPVRTVPADVHVPRGLRDQFRSDGTALPRPGVGLVPQCAGPRAVSVPVLARRQEMGGLSSRQRGDALGRPGQGQGRDHAILRSGQARPAPDQRAPYPAGIRRQVDVDGCQWPEPAPPDALCGLDARQ